MGLFQRPPKGGLIISYDGGGSWNEIFYILRILIFNIRGVDPIFKCRRLNEIPPLCQRSLYLKTQLVIFDFWQISFNNLLRQKQCYGVSQN
jgi:hypothetical protein